MMSSSHARDCSDRGVLSCRNVQNPTKKESALQRRLNYKPATKHLSPATKRALANSRRARRKPVVAGEAGTTKPSKTTNAVVNSGAQRAQTATEQQTSSSQKSTGGNWGRMKVCAKDGAPLCSSGSSALSCLLPGQTVDVARVEGQWAEVRMWVPVQRLTSVDSSQRVGMRSVVGFVL